jgi:signal transduction histidine kinase
MRAFTAGGVDYITKPFQVEEVLARVRTHLELQHTKKELENRLSELAQSNQRLEARNEELDAFAHTVAHNLKNPLSSLIGYSNFLGKYFEGMTAEEIQNHLKTIEKNGLKMSNIIAELLLLSSVRKQSEVPRAALSMDKIVQEAQKRLELLISEHQAEIITPETWPDAVGYAPWVEEIWANYLSNAIKYGGRPPEIKLGASPGENGMIKFWVRDNGQGLTTDEQEQIFTPFTRLHQANARGHGLGLSIVMRIAKKLDGEVGLSSKPGDGSTFYFKLPAAPA